MKKLNVGIFNDSFPPILDGVANTAVNYAKSIQKIYGKAVVATPWYPKVKDNYAFRVVRYSSTNVSKRVGYRMGNPFNPMLIRKLEKEKLDIIHIHSPFTSALLARVLRQYSGTPIVFTYHTKFDVDIEKRVAFNPLRKVSIKFLMSNINACDEVWVVSEGAGDNLKKLGYEGDYIIMENGTDFQKGRASDEMIASINAMHQISEEETVFLFVGRMMWYKNLKFTIDGLTEAKRQGVKFKMMFVGEGVDRPEIAEYIKTVGLEKECIFTGAVYDREVLRGYFSRANLFLFPSTYDTNGIVVREAAACGCPSLLIRESCAAEKIVHEDTGILIEETVEHIASEIVKACVDPGRLKIIGENASEKIYLSWDDAVGKAFKRYHEIINAHVTEKLNA
ncbi:glycosyltransferase [Fusibacter bizertensis]|uniref:Glycosyltransferase n=1 Tax=Fusibacter bizertensis TaxID=1488331 RepID=A0ABT6NA80_9FIRM|nr:glycosyltransferase [Fusibacter bizertensis]MDH8677322.1 glycosyltransferase [Fusibacter bizertensis]